MNGAGPKLPPASFFLSHEDPDGTKILIRRDRIEAVTWPGKDDQPVTVTMIGGGVHLLALGEGGFAALVRHL